MGGSVYPVNYVPQAQDGKLTFLQPTSDKLPQGYRIPYADPSSELAMSIGGENGEPAYLIPSFKYGKPLYNAIEEVKEESRTKRREEAIFDDDGGNSLSTFYLVILHPSSSPCSPALRFASATEKKKKKQTKRAPCFIKKNIIAN